MISTYLHKRVFHEKCDPNFLDFLDKSGAKLASGWPIAVLPTS
jgi:hypothetical protein